MDFEYYVDTFAKKVAEQKESIIKLALISKGINPDEYLSVMIDKQKRFNPILIEQHDKMDLIYYNDGSDNGLFIVGFSYANVDFSPTFDNHSHSMSMSVDLVPIFEEPEWNKKPKTKQ